MTDDQQNKVARDRHLRALIMVWLFTVVMVAAMWGHVEVSIRDGRLQTLKAAESDLSNLTRLTQEHAIRTFRSADQAIRFVQARYLELGNKLDIKDLTDKGVIDTEIFNQVGIIDAKGIYVLANLPVTGKLDLSDREHFRVHVPADTGELFISKPVMGRASGKWSIQLTRRITKPNGEFAGVVVVSIDPGYFTRFYGELNLGNEGLAALYGLDGIARARKVGAKEEFGTNAAAGVMFERIVQGKMEGSYISRSVVDGIERLYYFRKIPSYKLSVVAGRDTSELLSSRKAADDDLRLQATLATLLLIALAGAITRYLNQIRRDMLARRAAELVIQDRTEQLNALFALSPDGFVTFDRSLKVKYLNLAFVELTTGGELKLAGMGESDFEEWVNERCDRDTQGLDIKMLRAQIADGRVNPTTVLEISGNGKRVLKVGLRMSDSNAVSQILYFRDVTHETEVDRMKSEFLSTAAHELRTPMASIFGFTELLLGEELDSATQRELLGIVHRQSNLMAKILDELLDLARIESRRGKDFRFTKFSIQELVVDVCKSYLPPEGYAPPELRMPEGDIQVMADAGKLRQALLNVLSNAYKFSAPGAPVQLTVALGCTDEGVPGVCVRVRDHGIGMTPEQAARICERFYRADTSGKVLGTGLGMSIVKEIVELLGGSLQVESQLGEGTTVSLCLPC